MMMQVWTFTKTINHNDKDKNKPRTQRNKTKKPTLGSSRYYTLDYLLFSE